MVKSETRTSVTFEFEPADAILHGSVQSDSTIGVSFNSPANSGREHTFIGVRNIPVPVLKEFAMQLLTTIHGWEKWCAERSVEKADAPTGTPS